MISDHAGAYNRSSALMSGRLFLEQKSSKTSDKKSSISCYPR
ncbi:hypothetical protein HOT69_gp202 [Cyanophage S-TIM4]|uniref:Uncharacterized protein n=1 Tax=Cyanophage S-TIM4 TaxID=1048189 RepID=A0A345AWB8_9CAUD|nr:hypothetical protein HOT69_gp202 [Cyanophage S-TIM4]AXF41201.1 unknown [Cyanophage S-TIM4]